MPDSHDVRRKALKAKEGDGAVCRRVSWHQGPCATQPTDVDLAEIDELPDRVTEGEPL